jgi:hypothetical protein
VAEVEDVEDGVGEVLGGVEAECGKLVQEGVDVLTDFGGEVCGWDFEGAEGFDVGVIDRAGDPQAGELGEPEPGDGAQAGGVAPKFGEGGAAAIDFIEDGAGGKRGGNWGRRCGRGCGCGCGCGWVFSRDFHFAGILTGGGAHAPARRIRASRCREGSHRRHCWEGEAVSPL